MSVDQAINRIRKFRREKGWSINRLATTAGVAEATLRNIDEPDWNPKLRTLEKLEDVIAAEAGA